MSLSDASIVRLTNSTPMKTAQQAIKCQQIVEKAINIQQIAAPTFEEKNRAEYVMAEFQRIGLQNVEMDDLYNVYGWLPGNRQEALLISAHTDTVFPQETSLAIRRENSLIYGAGLGDNSLGVAALLTLAEIFIQHPLPRDLSLCFCANTREEGLGDLGGIKAVYHKIKSKVRAAVVIEGMALGRIYHAGIAVRRLKLTVSTGGGHSWLHFGQPSAIHALLNFGHEITQLNVPENPRTTYNIGVIEGGSSVNTIAAEASCLIDLRSMDMATLANLENQVRSIGERLTTSEVAFKFEVVGDRPAGSISADHPLVKLAKEAHQAIRMRPELDMGSTDANVLLANGIPTVCVGVSYGGNAHRLDEYIEIDPIENGVWQLLLLTTAAANSMWGS